jgi:hypothetical protein
VSDLRNQIISATSTHTLTSSVALVAPSKEGRKSSIEARTVADVGKPERPVWPHDDFTHGWHLPKITRLYYTRCAAVFAAKQYRIQLYSAHNWRAATLFWLFNMHRHSTSIINPAFDGTKRYFSLVFTRLFTLPHSVLEHLFVLSVQPHPRCQVGLR